ncbi:MerR family transcriptional regulator [Methylomarinum vadi]|uniref:MerR family transcriptional regulator n=1 Tax=Methylomarinum vadi TaxID=438855 RepID=UPI00055D58E6|nr:MerR family transcriptional regulator [Methylomarinum vadi]
MSDPQPQYLIGTVSKRSGVKPDLIRAWERRYKAIEPSRSDGKQRLYSDDDIVKLKLLHLATQHGHSIGQIAGLSIEQLRHLITPDISDTNATPIHKDQRHLCEDYLRKCLAAIDSFDSRSLEKQFENALLELGTLVFIEALLTPLLQQIGEHWQMGKLRPAQEHMASAIIRSMAYILRSNEPRDADAPQLVLATPIGNQHELGALLASIVAEFKGWQVTYLGPDLPAEEVAVAVKYQNAQAVALSISFDSDSLNTSRELRKLKKLIPERTAFIIGGRLAYKYQALAAELNAHVVKDGIEQFKNLLDELKLSS